MLLFLARLMTMPRFAASYGCRSRRAFKPLDPRIGERLEDGLLDDRLAIKVHMNQPGRAGLGIQHARQLAQ